MFDPKECDHVSMTEAKMQTEQHPVTEAALLSSISFVVMAETGQIDDVTIAEHPAVFTPWVPGVDYKVKDIRIYEGIIYRCRQAHKSQADWTPDTYAAGWAKVGDPGEEYPEWVQPLTPEDVYPVGSKVTSGGKRWIKARMGAGSEDYYAPGVIPGMWEEVN